MKIKVTLLSDLCTSSGESISGVIDIDSIFDEYGIPYIPGRRFKGILRDEACELLNFNNTPYNIHDIDRVFGKTGQFRSANLKIDNGYIPNYFEIVNEIKELSSSKYAKFYKPDFITNQFVSLRTQTTIERDNKRAKKTSLRVTRIVKSGLEFYFKIKIDDENDIQLIKDSCKVLRHMGMNRTRGYGEVRCELIEDHDNYDVRKVLISDGNKLKISYRNLSQLMLPGKNNDNTATYDYLPGSAILGAFASIYHRQHNLKDDAHEDNMFYDLFLSNKVIFNNAYITDNSKKDYQPVSLSLNRVKDGYEVYDKAHDDYQNLDMQLQKLGDLFVYAEEDILHKVEPLKKIEYHHLRSTKSKNIGHAVEGDGLFFQYESLLANQSFNGYIEGNKEYLSEIIKLIPKDGIIHLGRSKAAQYGKVVIENIEIVNSSLDNIYVDNNQSFVIKLLSQMILVNELGNYYPNVDLLVTSIKELLGDIKLENVFAKYTIVSGFNNKWKLPKVQMQALGEGTTLVLKNISGKTIDVGFLNNYAFGIRQNEGFGKIIVEKRLVKKYHFNTNNDEISKVEPKYTTSHLIKIQEELIHNEVEAYAILKANKIMPLNMTTINKLLDFIYSSNGYERLFEKINNIKDKTKKLRVSSVILDRDIYDEIRDINEYTRQAKDLLMKVTSQLNVYQDSAIVDSLKQSLDKHDFKWFKVYLRSLLIFMKLKVRGENING